jgi:outer membrane protein TolC
MRWCLFIVVLFYCSLSHAQDTTRTLSESEFLNIVRAYHPMVKQASLIVERAQADLTASRAGFDPAFYVASDRKTFDGKNYYNYVNPELKIPTWFGVEVKAGLENNSGSFTDPSLSLGKSSYLGVSVPVGKNLLMDKRRAALQQAKIFREQSKVEQSLAINDLLIDAVDTYWQWVQAYEVYLVLNETVRVNEERLKFVKTGWRQGERPALDTTEVLAQLQSFQIARNDAWLRWRNGALELSNYLWLANDSPYYLPETVLPDPGWKRYDVNNAALPLLEELLATARNLHPKLSSYNYKLQILDVEKRLKFQNLLPTVDFRYNILNTDYNVFKNGSWAYYQNNYKFGFDIGMPLRLSQGRGEYRAAKIKIQETELDLSMTRLSIQNKVKAYFNDLANLQQQVRLAEASLDNYQRLFRGEDIRFKYGESTLFIINSRENKVLESRQKLIELRTKFMKSMQAVIWSTGQLR